ncbi:sulfite exporter TauE/SafE family protein [Noviherbaspirillum cavernae]|uniref:Sulfite exporter TauE/SafE family protein n=2 Tax=Noviherbaspirillum cavernae TaxID=2320862 RepID=A0A418WV57_9BURK|nr:sulfite exporter TauE/SafE family protein [Noviherbaspirillum cavernae]RJF96596.1 sulfite exporter TauE/SafE family protein [Noviherbaspirillum cavernae]
MIGLLGSVHCIGMCGGIVSALSIAPGTRKVFPVALAGGSGIAAPTAVHADVMHVIAYNAGRIGSYAMAGAVAGGIAQGVRGLSVMPSLQLGTYWLANLMLIALGLYLMDAWHGLTRLEAAGRFVWRRVQPLTARLLPMDNSRKALALGALWGWLPCGMVYSVLLTAMLSGSALDGALVMAAFGLGTLPMVASMGMLGMRLQGWLRRRRVRVASGLVILAFGIAGLARAGSGFTADWLEEVCVSPLSSHASDRTEQ